MMAVPMELFSFLKASWGSIVFPQKVRVSKDFGSDT
jgi:hypothetical protein